MKLLAILRTTDYRGDHSADVEIDFEIVPGEKIEELVARLQLRMAHDEIAIKFLHEPEDKVVTS